MYLYLYLYLQPQQASLLLLHRLDVEAACRRRRATPAACG
jgi:hypothetical protein